MRTCIGDNANMYIPSQPRTHEIGVMCFMPRKLTKYSGNVLYWILQLCLLLINISINILCNPIVWFMVKTIFNILSDVFIYLVLGVCSFLISIITHIDDYYTREKYQAKKYNVMTDSARDGIQVQNCTVKRFVQASKEY